MAALLTSPRPLSFERVEKMALRLCGSTLIHMVTETNESSHQIVVRERLHPDDNLVGFPTSDEGVRVLRHR